MGTTYDWTLAGTADDQIYSLHANTSSGGATYTLEVTNAAAYNDIATNLVKDATHDWSMKFVAPSAFNASDTGDDKTATVTLVAREQGT